MNLLFFIIAIIPFIAGCQSLNQPANFDSPRSKPAVGTSVQLNQTLTFLPGTSRTYIQNGQKQTFSGIDEREPWCQFYRYEPAAALQTIRTVQPDSFIVKHSSQKMELVELEPVKVAASMLIIPSMLDHDVNARTLSTIMKIRSYKQPEIVELKCAVFDDPFHGNFVSVSQIIKTLGSVVTLKFDE